MLFALLRHIHSMINILKKFRQSTELKKLVKAHAETGTPLSVMEDVVFKAMLSAGTEDSNCALRSLLSACIGREVRTAQVINNDLIPAHLAGKAPRLDVNVTFNDGESANLEMQMEKTGDDLKKRALVYASMLLAGQSQKGKSYKVSKRVYQIFFLNRELFPASPVFPRRYSYREAQEHDQLTDSSEIFFYELPKLDRQVQKLLSGKIGLNDLSADEKWCIFMKYRHEGHAARLVEQLYQQEEGIMRAEKAVNGISRDYIKYIRWMSKEKDRLDRGQMLEDAHDQGMERRNVEIARNLLHIGLSKEQIQEATGLDLETIQSITNNRE